MWDHWLFFDESNCGADTETIRLNRYASKRIEKLLLLKQNNQTLEIIVDFILCINENGYFKACTKLKSFGFGRFGLSGLECIVRNKLPLSAFMPSAERMLPDWFVSAEQHPFQSHITYDDSIDIKA